MAPLLPIRASSLTFVFLLSLLAAASAETTSAPSPDPAPTSTTDDLATWLNLREPSYMAPITVSADGKWLAVMMKGPQSEGSAATANLPSEAGMFEAASEDLAGSEVFIVQRATGKVSRPFQNYVASYSPTWSPSGETLLLAVQDAATRLPRLATWSPGDDKPRVFLSATYMPDIGFSGPAWTPDGRKIVFACYDVTPQKPPRIQEKITPVDTQAGSPTIGTNKNTLAELSLDSGQVRTFSGFGPYGYAEVWGFRLAPDGKSAAFLAHAAPVRQGAEANWVKLTTVNLETGAVQSIGDTQSDNWCMTFSWSPDCRHVAWVPTVGDKLKVLIATTGDKPAAREAALPADFQAGQLYDADDWPSAPPLWAADAGSFWLPGKNALLHFSVDGSPLGTVPLPRGKGGSDWLECAAQSFAPVRTQAVPASGAIRLLRKKEIETVDLTAAPSPKITSIPVTAATERAIDWATATLFTLHNTGFHGWELMQTSLTDGKSSRLALIQPALTGIDLGTTRTLTWKLPTGEPCAGTLLLPLGWKPGDKPPVVMEVYGDERNNGNQSAEAMTDIEMFVYPHLLSARGYALFKPDMPQTHEEPAASLARSADAAADALTVSGFVDANRIAITGESYGGYTVLCAVVASNKFKAAIAVNGIYDLTRADTETTAESFAWTEDGQGLMGAPLWSKTQRYIDNSPLFALDKLQTPLLLVQGESDDITNTQGPALYGALLRLGKPAVYLSVAGMQHNPASWSTEAQEDYIPRVLTFLDKYLKPKP